MVKSALRKYHDVIKEIGHINLMLSPQDEFLQLAFDELKEEDKVLLIIDGDYIGMVLIYNANNSKSEHIKDLNKLNNVAKTTIFFRLFVNFQ